MTDHPNRSPEQELIELQLAEARRKRSPEQELKELQLARARREEAERIEKLQSELKRKTDELNRKYGIPRQ
jgi:hypothetical protein